MNLKIVPKAEQYICIICKARIKNIDYNFKYNFRGEMHPCLALLLMNFLAFGGKKPIAFLAKPFPDL